MISWVLTRSILPLSQSLPPLRITSPLYPLQAKFAAVGFVFTCLVLFVIFYFDDKIKTADDVEKYLGLTVLGVIPNISKE